MLLTRENPVLAELVTRKESGSGKAGLCEFEALVLSDPDSLLGAYLEEINDSHQTASSKRLLSYLSDYSKVVAGPLAIDAIGLEQLRRHCSHFNDWMGRMESI